ncbi:MAG TPA: hypothetical protein VFZ67_00910 [Nitrososphaera sp.]
MPAFEKAVEEEIEDRIGGMRDGGDRGTIFYREGKKQKVNLKNVYVSLNHNCREGCDLVSYASSIALIEHISSNDRSILKNPGVHCVLYISAILRTRSFGQK